MPQAEQDISVPPEAGLKFVLSAVRIKKAEIDALLMQTMFRRIDLESLCLTPGSLSLSEPPYATVHLQQRPLLCIENDVIIVAPHRLAEALVHRIIQVAAEMGVHETLAEEFHRRMFLTADRNLERLGLRLSTGGLAARTEIKDTIATHAIYQCDRDKALLVSVVSDALHDGDVRMDAEWSTVEIEEEIRTAREAASKLLAAATPPISNWLSLIVLGGIGRNYTVSVASPAQGEPDLLVFSGADLEAIVLAEGANRSALLLWRYAQARRELETRCEIFAWSSLDTYALWHDRDRVFPANVNMLVVDPTFGRGFREYAVAQYDWHAIPTPTQGNTIEVGLADGPEQPIYMPRSFRSTRVEIAVERPGLVMWVLSNSDELPEDRTNWFDAGRMMAYWLSEFSDHLAAEFAGLGAVSDVVVVEFELLAQVKPVGAIGDYHITPRSRRVVHVEIYSTFVEIYDDTNAAERQFAANLVRCILQLGEMSADTAADAVTRALDTVAPLGVKRMLHCINTSWSPEFIGAAALPRPRYPHSAECITIRRRVLQTSPLPNVPMGSVDTVKWLNAAVAGIYRNMCDLLASLNGRNILERLLVNNEALVHEDAVQELTLASRLACYRSFESMHKRLLQEGPRHASASMVTRFLIEHVAAQPPLGTRMVSDLELDTLLAMGLEIVMLGMASDVAQLELADVRVRTEEGDLVIDRGTYEEATEGNVFEISRDRLDRERSRGRVRHSRRATENAEPSALISRLETASYDEFGVELSLIGKVFGEALAIAQELSCAVVIVSRDRFARRVGERLSLDDDTVDRVLNFLTLAPRSTFTKPPAGFEAGDIWPWRFNRALSYIRRPFVLMRGAEGDVELHFTPGHVYRASTNLITLITTGRLKARSKSLSRVMGEFTKEASDAFNEEVAEVLRTRGFVVRMRAAKFGKERIVDPKGNSLGDIDVLCLDAPKHRLIAIECKDFQMARVPHEVRTDLEELFLSSERKRCAQEKHTRRVTWLQQHVDQVVSSMGGNSTEAGWRVEGAFAFSVALISPLLGHARLPVWTLQDLRDGRGP